MNFVSLLFRCIAAQKLTYTSVLLYPYSLYKEIYHSFLNDDFLPFTLFQENGEIKTFIGNKDVNTVRKNSLPSVIYTRAIRFYPKSYNDSIALRVELYGYPAGKVG